MWSKRLLPLLFLVLSACGPSAETTKYLDDLGPVVNHTAQFETLRAEVLAKEIKAMSKMGRGKFKELPKLEAALREANGPSGQQEVFLLQNQPPEELKGFYVAYLVYLKAEEEYFKSVSLTLLNMRQFWDQNQPLDSLPSFQKTWKTHLDRHTELAGEVAEKFSKVEATYKNYRN